MQNRLTFTTTVDTATNKPIDYTITGYIVIDGDESPIGYNAARFDWAFDELCYWVHQVPDCKVTFKTTTYQPTTN